MMLFDNQQKSFFTGDYNSVIPFLLLKDEDEQKITKTKSFCLKEDQATNI